MMNVLTEEVIASFKDAARKLTLTFRTSAAEYPRNFTPIYMHVHAH
jgi:hypothetical protein